MIAAQIIFILIALITLFSALRVVTTRNLVHAALWLVVALFGVAVLFAFLNAGFLAVAQVVIYIGAISILLIFTIMLTRRVIQDTGSLLNANWGWAVVVSVVMFGALSWMLYQWNGFSSTAPVMPDVDKLKQLGVSLVNPGGYLLPFELASILLLAALVGAVIVAWDRK